MTLSGWLSLSNESLAAESIASRRIEGSSQVSGERIINLGWFAAKVDCGSEIFSAETFVIAFDGRLDNRAELARDLGLSLPISPAALVLYGWSRLGPAILQRVLGDFAFVIADDGQRTCFLARDHAGQRPLLFAEHDGGLIFGSRAIELSRMGHSLTPSISRMAALLAGIDEAATQTAFDGITGVRPGESITCGPQGVRPTRWWNPPVGPLPSRKAQDYTEEYRFLLDQAVHCRAQEGLIATQLSSGWDSSAITGTAARLFGAERVVAFTSAPMHPVSGKILARRSPDESALAGTVAAMHGIDHRIVRELPRPFDVARHSARTMQSPDPNPLHSAWWHEIRCQAAEQGATTLLTGELGNLSLNAGGLNTLAVFVQNRDWRRWYREARNLVRTSQVRWRGALMSSFGAQLPERVVTALQLAFNQPRRAGYPVFLNKHLSDGSGNDRGSVSPYEQRFDALRNYDVGALRIQAAEDWGLAEADPMADRRIIEWSLTLPPEKLLNDGKLRPLARASLADRVPEAILDSRSRGLQSAGWYQDVTAIDAREVLEEISAVTMACELLDIAALDRTISRWPTENWNSPATYALFRRELIPSLSMGLFIKEFSR